MSKLKDRISSYKEISDHKLISRLPLILTINGRSFHKTTSLLEKPFCVEFSTCMISTMNYLCTNIDGVVFAYFQNDEITIILKNDQSQDTQAWCDNKIQKIVSLASSMATFHFNEIASAIELNTLNDRIFYSNCFVVPNISEAINVLILKQQSNFYMSVHNACFYELLKNYNEKEISEKLSGLSIDEKKDLLIEDCNVDFSTYPVEFRKGIAMYKSPKIIDGKLKVKWIINKDCPVFSKEQSFVEQILNTGQDIIRN